MRITFTTPLAFSLLQLALADPTVYVVDCVQYGEPVRSYLAYYADSQPWSQNKPDSIASITPSTGANQFDTTATMDGLGALTINIGQDYVPVYSQSGTGSLNGKNWRCHADSGRLLYTDLTYASALSPFAQCLTRSFCNPVPDIGAVKIDFQFAVGCDGQGTKKQRRTAKEEKRQGITLCGGISPSTTLFITTYDFDRSTQLCYDAIELSGDLSDDVYGHTFTSTACGVSVTLGSADFWMTSIPMSGTVVSPSGLTVDIPEKDIESDYSSPGIGSIWTFSYLYGY